MFYVYHVQIYDVCIACQDLMHLYSYVHMCVENYKLYTRHHCLCRGTVVLWKIFVIILTCVMMMDQT